MSSHNSHILLSALLIFGLNEFPRIAEHILKREEDEGGGGGERIKTDELHRLRLKIFKHETKLSLYTKKKKTKKKPEISFGKKRNCKTPNEMENEN